MAFGKGGDKLIKEEWWRTLCKHEGASSTRRPPQHPSEKPGLLVTCVHPKYAWSSEVRTGSQWLTSIARRNRRALELTGPSGSVKDTPLPSRLEARWLTVCSPALASPCMLPQAHRHSQPGVTTRISHTGKGTAHGQCVSLGQRAAL